MYELIENAIKEFRLLGDKPLRVISHLDCDGITSSSIMIKILKRENKKFVLSIVKQLNEKVMKELSLENYNIFIFTDLGSGYLKLINKYLKNKKIFIFDHHTPDDFTNYDNIIHINPHLTEYFNSFSNLSGSGITYLFAKSLNQENKDLAHLAVIGTIGDSQEFTNINKEILDDAVSQGKLMVKYGLKMFGSQTKPLHKILQYSTDPFIPGVTGDEQGTFEFLSQIGIDFIEEGKVKRIIDLNEDELKKLTTAIILRRLGTEKDPKDIFGNIYILKDELDDGLKDAREFSTLLNCCGRLNKPSVGVGICLDNYELKQKANDLLKQYQLELVNGLNWFYSNKDALIKGDNFVIINAEFNMRDTLIGTVISIISKSNVYKDGTILLGMAYTPDNNIKISMRVCNSNKYNLTEILKKIVKNKGEVGGHKQAAGALIAQEYELEFINHAKEVLSEINRKVY